MGSGKGLAATVLKGEFYAQHYRVFRTVFLVTMALLAGSVTGNVLLALNQPEPRYFALGPDGRLIPMIALNRPYRSEAEVVDFAIKGITRAFTLNFHEWRRQMQEAKEWFTEDGWARVLAEMERQRMLEMIEAKKLVVTAYPMEAGVVVGAGQQDGTYKWLIQFPMAMTIVSPSEKTTDERIITVTVTRVSTLMDPGGIRIEEVRDRKKI